MSLGLPRHFHELAGCLLDKQAKYLMMLAYMSEQNPEPSDRSEIASLGGQARADSLTPERRKEIAQAGSEARWGRRNVRPTSPIGSNSIQVNSLPSKKPVQSIGKKSQLDLFVDKELEIDGIGMGVLSDGTAFLTGRGLARLCAVSNARIVELGQNWNISSTIAMVEGVKKILHDKGLLADTPYVEIKQRSGVLYAYPDAICLAVLEYYAFDQPTEEANSLRGFSI